MKKLHIDLRTYTMVFALLIIWAVFYSQTDGVFLSPRNLSNLFVNTCVVGVMAVGMVFVIVSGNIDLSIGSVACFIGAIVTMLCYTYHVDPTLAVVIGLLAGVAIGFTQGAITAYFKVPAFIVTLGGMMIYRGASMWILGGMDRQFDAGWANAIGNGYLPELATYAVTAIAVGGCIFFTFRSRASRIKYGFDTPPVAFAFMQAAVYSLLITGVVYYLNKYKGIPFSVFILVLIVLAMTFVANRTRFGRHVYGLGGNAEAAHLSGINVKVRLTQVFVLMGLLCAVAGIMLTSYVGSASQKAGSLKELDAIAACVIGGTSLMGGKGSVPGAILGALIMASLDNGIDFLGSPPALRYIIKGGVLVVAVLIDMMTQKEK